MNRKYTVFVAEDEVLLANDLTRQIKALHLELEVVGQAYTGLKAYNQIMQKKPDVVITDIRMPVWDGLRLLEEIKKNFPYIKCIVISGYSDFNYAQKALKLQIFDYLLKPVNNEKLCAVLKKVTNTLDLERKSYTEIFMNLASKRDTRHLAWLLKEFFIHNFTKDINLNILADVIGYSNGNLTKLYEQYYEITPSKYITTLRLGYAKNLLQNRPDLSVREVGKLCGYPEQCYFSKIFKKYTGVSPAGFRTLESD